jgi:hypothetical protein
MQALDCFFCKCEDSLAWATGVAAAGSICVLCSQCLNDSTGVALSDEERAATKCDSLAANGCARGKGGHPVWYCYTCKSLMCGPCNDLLHTRASEGSHDVRHASLAQFDDTSMDAALDERLKKWGDLKVSSVDGFNLKHWTTSCSEGIPGFVCLCCTGLEGLTKSFKCGGRATQSNEKDECSTSFTNHLRDAARHKRAPGAACVCACAAFLGKPSSGQS